MQVVPLTYELLKAAQDDLTQRYKEYVPKLTNRATFKPEFDLVTVGPPRKAGTIATVNLSIIELGMNIDVTSRSFRKIVPQTKLIHYAIHDFAFAEPLPLTAWGQMPEANAYSGAITDWLQALHFKPKAAALVPAETAPPAAPAAVPEPPAAPQVAPAAAPPPPTKPLTDSYCPHGPKHLYSEPHIGGYSWHGPVYVATCTKCGYHWSDH
jgi:hypothetical protein